MTKKELMSKAHKLTKEIKTQYPEVDYKFQLGLCIAYLHEEGEKEMSKETVKELNFKTSKGSKIESIFTINEKGEYTLTKLTINNIDITKEEKGFGYINQLTNYTYDIKSKKAIEKLMPNTKKLPTVIKIEGFEEVSKLITSIKREYQSIEDKKNERKYKLIAKAQEQEKEDNFDRFMNDINNIK